MGIVSFSFTCSIVLIILDLYLDRKFPEENVIEEDEINFSSFKSLSLMLWLLVLACLTLYGILIPFNNIASAFISSKYLSYMKTSEAEKIAGGYMAVPFFIGAVFIPLCGYVIDKVGKRAYFILTASGLAFLSMCIFYTNVTPLIPLLTLGFAYSIFASVIWPGISLVCSKEKLGLAYGIATSIQNGGLALFPLIIAGILTSSSQNYNFVSLIFLYLGFSFSSGSLCIVDNFVFDDNIWG